MHPDNIRGRHPHPHPHPYSRLHPTPIHFTFRSLSVS